jgi:hypothetical protein
MKRVFTIVLGGSVAAALASGCEAIVGGDLPAFSCTPGAADACALGQVCSPAGVCVASCPETPCEDGTACNTEAHFCVPLGQLPEAGAQDGTLPDTQGEDQTAADAFVRDSTIENDSPTATGEVGAQCQTQGNCLPGLICADSSILTPPVVQKSGPVCTKACCSSEECPPDFACFGPGSGGNYCVRASQLQRGTAKGAKPGGSSCATGADCRSGVCQGSTALRCADACCTGAGTCSGGGVCRLETIEGHITMACAEPPAGSTGNDTFCVGSSDCKSGICYGSSASCRPRCCGAASCAVQSPPYGACVYFSQNGAVKEYVPGCLYPNTSPPGGGKVGDPCDPAQQDILCSTALCDPMGKYCTDVCCTDADCAGYPGYTVCRPSINPRFLTCQKPG